VNNIRKKNKKDGSLRNELRPRFIRRVLFHLQVSTNSNGALRNLPQPKKKKTSPTSKHSSEKKGGITKKKKEKKGRNVFFSQLKKLMRTRIRGAVISAKNHKRQRRKRQSVIAKQEKSQTPKVLTAILTSPSLN